MEAYRKTTIGMTLAATILAGCGGGSGGNTAGTAPPATAAISEDYQGIWIAAPYGWALDIGTDSFQLLDYTSEFCIEVSSESEVDTADVESQFRLLSDQLDWYASNGTAEFGAPGVRFTHSEELPTSCAQGISPQAGDAGYQRDPRRDLYLFAQLISEYSVYPELRDKDTESLYREIEPTLSQDSGDEALAEALFQLAQPFADIHATVETSVGLVKILNKPSFTDRLVDEWLQLEGVTPPLSDMQIQAANAYISEQATLHRQITLSYAESTADVRQAANDLLTWYQADGIGYLAVDAMLGFGDVDDNHDELRSLESALDTALHDLRDAQALIVDVRRNGGGKDFLSLAIAGRFAANEIHAYSKQARLGLGRSELIDVYVQPRGSVQYLGPVYLLTSNETASAAEVFTLTMRELPQVTVIGEATQGGLSDQLSKRLFNGWDASVGNEYYLSADGIWFEGTGIPVAAEVPQFTKQARENDTDSSIEMVIEMLSN